MVLAPMLDWLALRTHRAAVGVHLSSAQLTVAGLRPEPLRLTAVARDVPPRGSVVEDELRLIEPVAERVARLLDRLRFGAGAPIVVTVNPFVDRLRLDRPDGWTHGVDCLVRRWSVEQAEALVGRLGAGLVAVDPAPVAAMRLVEVLDPGGSGTVRVGGWDVVRNGDERWAEPAGADRAIGGVSADRLIEVQRGAGRPRLLIPRSVRRRLDLSREGVAIGAALSGLGVGPTVETVGVDGPAGGGWVVQPIDDLAYQGVAGGR